VQFVCLGAVQMKDELARDLEYGGQQLLLTVVVLIVTYTVIKLV